MPLYSLPLSVSTALMVIPSFEKNGRIRSFKMSAAVMAIFEV